MSDSTLSDFAASLPPPEMLKAMAEVDQACYAQEDLLVYLRKLGLNQPTAEAILRKVEEYAGVFSAGEAARKYLEERS